MQKKSGGIGVNLRLRQTNDKSHLAWLPGDIKLLHESVHKAHYVFIIK